VPICSGLFGQLGGHAAVMAGEVEDRLKDAAVDSGSAAGEATVIGLSP
jgi:hypothetical protein